MSQRVLLALLAPALLAAGCGGGGSGKSGSSNPEPAASTSPQVFPKGAGATYQDIRARYPESLSVGIGASVMRDGLNRVPFLILDKGARPVTNAPVALYTMHNDGTGVRGPFLAREEAFGIKPAYLSKTTTSDPDQQKGFYVADVRVGRKVPIAVFGLVRMDGRLVATSPSGLGVKLSHAPPPDVGQAAISMHTETLSQVGGDAAKVTTRVPPDKDMVSEDFATVLGRKPVVLVFATPALCQSRVCGPDVDVAEQVKAELGDRVAFIHQEIYVDNKLDKGLRPQLGKWRLESEPWLFVIGRDRRIKARIEGAVSVAELRRAVRAAL